MLPQIKRPDLPISCRNTSIYCLQFNVSKLLTTEDFSVYVFFYFPIMRQERLAKLGSSTWWYHCSHRHPSVPGAGFRAGTEEIQQSIYNHVCCKPKRRWERGETGNLWVSGQRHLSPLPRLPDLLKSNCVISQRRWTLSRDVKGGTKGSCLGQNSECLFQLMAWVITSIRDFQLQEFITWLCL